MAEALVIAVPYYSGLAYLEEALSSLRAQTDPEWRALVVDDSPEKHGARELVERAGDDRIRYAVHPGNLGMVPCWNRCLDEAGGELVTLLHADDLLLGGYVAEVKRLAAAHPEAVALFTASRTIGERGEHRPSLQDGIKRFFVPRGAGDVRLAGDGGLRALLRGNFVICGSVCWRRGLLRERRFDPRWRQVQDLELYARLLFAGETLAGSRVRGYAYRRHARNATARQTESLLRFDEEYRLFDEVAAEAERRGWRKTACTARGKTILKLHLGWRATGALLGLRPRAAGRYLGFLGRGRR